MRGDCVYMQVLVQMYLKGWDNRTLAEKTGMTCFAERISIAAYPLPEERTAVCLLPEGHIAVYRVFV